MPLINCKVALKFKLMNHSVLSAAGAGNDDTNSNNIIFTINNTKLCVSVVTLSAKDNQKLSKLLSKGFERSIYWNEYKTKSENKDMTNEYKIKSNFVGVDRLFVLVYSNVDDSAEKYKARRYYIPKGAIKNYYFIITRKNFYDQPIDSDINQYKEIRKLATGHGEDDTTGYLLDYDYIKNHCRIIAVNLNRQKELAADPKAIQQIEFVG